MRAASVCLRLGTAAILLVAAGACGGRTTVEPQAKLVDAGGAVTNSSATCMNATPIALSDHNAPSAIALDDTRVYWLDQGFVGSVPKAGGAVTNLAKNNFGLVGIAVDDDSVYWTSGAAEMMRTPKGGGTTTTLLPADSSIGQGVVRAQGGYLYWLANQASPNARIMRIRKDGTSNQMLLDGRHFNDIAVDETGIYFTTLDGVGRLPLDGGAPVDLAKDAYAWGLAVDATDVYWYTLASDIKKVPKVGGVVTTILSSLVPAHEYAILSIAVSDKDVFFGTDEGNPPRPQGINPAASGRVRAAPKAGGAAVELASGLHRPLGLALDADALYWVDYGVEGTLVGAVIKMCRER